MDHHNDRQLFIIIKNLCFIGSWAPNYSKVPYEFKIDHQKDHLLYKTINYIGKKLFHSSFLIHNGQPR